MSLPTPIFIVIANKFNYGICQETLMAITLKKFLALPLKVNSIYSTYWLKRVVMLLFDNESN